MLQKTLRLGGRVRIALGINKGLGLNRLNERVQPKEMLSPAFRAELEQEFALERELRQQFVAGTASLDGDTRSRVTGEQVQP